MKIPVLSLLALLAGFAPAFSQARPKTESELQGAKSYNQAVAAFSAGDYAKSIPLFLAADSLLGDSKLVDRIKLRYALGVAFLKTGHPAQALERFEWVTGQDSAYPYIEYQAAESARLAGQTEQALLHYRQALPRVMQNDKPLILQQIGDLLQKRGDLNGSLKAFNEALGMTPLPAVSLLRGQVYDKLAEKIDHAEDENFDVEKAIRDSVLTVEKLEKAMELRTSALEDYRAAAGEPKLASAAAKYIERSGIIIANDKNLIAEIRYQKENP